jgi:hypothetical protein
MSSTFATVIIQAADQAAAQEDFPGSFTAGYTNNPDEPTIATNYVSSGYFFDEELDKIVNDVTWPRVVRFGDAQQALIAMGLVPVETTDGNQEA